MNLGRSNWSIHRNQIRKLERDLIGEL
jgi:uncharacterized protein (UPF0297 family)